MWIIETFVHVMIGSYENFGLFLGLLCNRKGDNAYNMLQGFFIAFKTSSERQFSRTRRDVSLLLVSPRPLLAFYGYDHSRGLNKRYFASISRDGRKSAKF